MYISVYCNVYFPDKGKEVDLHVHIFFYNHIKQYFVICMLGTGQHGCVV